MDDEIPVEAPNQKRDHSGGGGSDFYDVQCVAYGNGYALRATKRLIGRGNADTIGKAAFLLPIRRLVARSAYPFPYATHCTS